MELECRSIVAGRVVERFACLTIDLWTSEPPHPYSSAGSAVQWLFSRRLFSQTMSRILQLSGPATAAASRSAGMHHTPPTLRSIARRRWALSRPAFDRTPAGRPDAGRGVRRARSRGRPLRQTASRPARTRDDLSCQRSLHGHGKRRCAFRRDRSRSSERAKSHSTDGHLLLAGLCLALLAQTSRVFREHVQRLEQALNDAEPVVEI